MEEKSKHKAYYQKVAGHFDQDARLFEQRYEENLVLQKIRNTFRRYTESLPFNEALEIGSGPGIDLVYFARKYPEKSIAAIDVSPEMVNISNKNLQESGAKNAIAKTGSVEDIPALFPDRQFDLVYVYFGGLNTVPDLRKTAQQLNEIISVGGHLVLTCVNRYYVMDIVYKSLKFKFKEAVSRFRNRWKGYSPGRDLPSNVYSASYVKKCFSPEFSILFRRGFSILYPPWFGLRPLHKFSFLMNILWKVDQLLQKTPCWNRGEYSLYIMKKEGVSP